MATTKSALWNMGMRAHDFLNRGYNFEHRLMRSLAYDDKNFKGPDGQKRLSFASLENAKIRAMAEEHATEEVPVHNKGIPKDCKLTQDSEKHVQLNLDCMHYYKKGAGTEAIFESLQWNENHFCSPGDCSKCDEFHRFHITLAFRNEHWATILTHHTREDPGSCLIVCGMSHVFKRGKKKWSLLTWLEHSGWTITPCEGLKIPAAPQSSGGPLKSDETSAAA